MRRILTALRRAFTGAADADRHAVLVRRFGAAVVLRAQAVKDVRARLADFDPVYLPRRDEMFSVVADQRGLGLWAGTRRPFRFLLLPWPAVGPFHLRSYVDYPIRDLIAVDGGHVTHLLVASVGDRTLELAIWGTDEIDQTEALLDDYGLRRAIERLDSLRRRI